MAASNDMSLKVEKETGLGLTLTKTQRFEPTRTYSRRDADYQFTEVDSLGLAKIASIRSAG